MENRDSTRLSNIFSDPSLQGEDGFVDPNKVFDAIAQENRGDPFMSGDESIAFGEEQQEFERVQAALEEAGLTLDDDTEALLDLLSPLDDVKSRRRSETSRTTNFSSLACSSSLKCPKDCKTRTERA